MSEKIHRSRWTANVSEDWVAVGLGLALVALVYLRVLGAIPW